MSGKKPRRSVIRPSERSSIGSLQKQGELSPVDSRSQSLANSMSSVEYLVNSLGLSEKEARALIAQT
jgi:hypothetical protein